MPKKPGRKKIGDFFINEISLLHFQRGLGAKQIHQYFVDSFDTDWRYGGHPSYETIKKYVRLVNKPENVYRNQMKDFEYPRDLGSGKDEVPWELGTYAMDCLGFYLEHYDVRPCVGLAKRYAQIAVLFAKDTDPPMDNRTIAILAEKFWYADVAEVWGDERPSTAFDEIKLALRAFTAKDQHKLHGVMEKMGVEEWHIPHRNFVFLSGMPIFKKTWEDYKQTLWKFVKHEEQEYTDEG